MRIKIPLMLLRIFLISCFWLLPSTFASQIEKTIDYSFGKKVIHHYGEASFTAEITFDPLPELNKTSTVYVKIQAMCDLDLDPQYIVFSKHNNLIDFTELIPSTWTPPIKEGDIFEGRFTITPIEIGQFHFEIKPRRPHQMARDCFDFYLVIDESGKLVHLFKEVDLKHEYMPIHPPIVGDEVELKYPESVVNDFLNIFCISPFPSLNETSTVTFELTSLRECPEGVQYFLDWTRNMEIFDMPNSWLGVVKKGQVYIDSFKIVPTDTGCHWFKLRVRAKALQEQGRSSKARGNYHCTFFIDETAKLTYIGRGPIHNIRLACAGASYKSKSFISQPQVFEEEIHHREIKSIINYGWDLGKDDPNRRRAFVAQITYDSLPEVNKTSRIFVKIRSKSPHEDAPRFMVRVFEWAADYTQLEPEWEPPIDPDYIYEGSFTITPREIGPIVLSIVPWGEAFRGSTRHRFNLCIIFDESGKAVNFSNTPCHYNGLPSHPPIGDDQVFIRSYSFSDFRGSFRIVPPLSLNDTSTIYAEVESRSYCPEGIQFYFRLSSNLDMITVPPSWVGEVNEGDVYKDSFKIVPTTTELAFLWLDIECSSASKEAPDKKRVNVHETFELHFSFDASGKLDYVGRENKYFDPDGKLPWDVAASRGEEYRDAKGGVKKFWSEPIIPVKRNNEK